MIEDQRGNGRLDVLQNALPFRRVDDLLYFALQNGQISTKFGNVRFEWPGEEVPSQFQSIGFRSRPVTGEDALAGDDVTQDAADLCFVLKVGVGEDFLAKKKIFFDMQNMSD